MRSRGSIFPGVILVIFGAFLLMDRLDFDIHWLDWDVVLSLLAILFGLKLWANALYTKRKGKVFPGTLFLVIGSFFFLYHIGILERYFFDLRYGELWAIVPLAFGLSFLSLFLVNPKNWLSLFPAIIFLGVGGILFGYMLGYIDRWQLREIRWYLQDAWYDFNIEAFFPLLLVIIGALLIYRSFKKARIRREANAQFKNNNP